MQSATFKIATEIAIRSTLNLLIWKSLKKLFYVGTQHFFLNLHVIQIIYFFSYLEIPWLHGCRKKDIIQYLTQSKMLQIFYFFILCIIIRQFQLDMKIFKIIIKIIIIFNIIIMIIKMIISFSCFDNFIGTNQ